MTSHRSQRFNIRQLNLFTKTLKFAHLVAFTSPRRAFYRIWIEDTAGEFSVVKESGIKGRVLDKRAWPLDSIAEAIKMFESRVKAKTNQARRSPRIYTIIKETDSRG